jgi:hypothetical protein
MVIPYAEAWYPGDVPTSAIEDVLIVAIKEAA